MFAKNTIETPAKLNGFDGIEGPDTDTSLGADAP